MATFNYTSETLGGTTYFETVSNRGNVTTAWTDERGDTFVITNRSTPKHIDDIKRPSKELKALLEVMAA